VQVQQLISRRLGLAFTEGRQADLTQGFTRACRSSPVPTFSDYLAWLEELPDDNPEWRRLAAYLTVGETHFFRDSACFDALERHVLPNLLEARRREGVLRLRIWSAACSTGEEPYSLAMVLDRLLPDRARWVITLLATDISSRALEAAHRGRYRDWSFRETPAWIRQRYFRGRGDGTVEVDPPIRAMVTLAALNLATDSYPSPVTNTGAMDLILCRNVLMYFTRAMQQATVARLQRALVPGGWLIVSPAEASAELFRPLVPVNFPGAIFYRKGQELVDPSGATSLAEAGFSEFAAPLREACLPARSSPLERREKIEPDPAADLEQARALADQGQLEQAQKLCTTLLSRDRLNVDAYLLFAAIAHERGELRAAHHAAHRALYLAPDSAIAHYLMGSVLFRQGHRRRGRKSMETVVTLLRGVPRDTALPGGDGLSAGRLLEMARTYLEFGE